MTSICFRRFQLGFMLGDGAIGFDVRNGGFGRTPAEQQQACSGDAFQFCGAEIPTSIGSRSDDSQQIPPFTGLPGLLRPDPEPSEAAAVPVGKPVSIKPAAARKRGSARSPGSRPSRLIPELPSGSLGVGS